MAKMNATVFHSAAYDSFKPSPDLSGIDTDHPLFIFPGFADVHVHFREPGFSMKETIRTGTEAAARGGYTAVCTMPNLDPVPDSPAHLKPELQLIERDAVIHVYPYGAITVNEAGEMIADLEGMVEDVIAFSDDGKGIQEEEMMREAMRRAKSLGKMIVAHCEVNALLNGGYIHDGSYAKAHGHRGISSASEYEQVRRDVKLALETGCRYHVCHVSTKESVEAVREAKKLGADVSCETAPHYLLLTEDDLQEEGRFKMNPPVREKADRDALIEGILDGTVEIIATDHAPHTAAEKARGLEKSAFGIVGIETAFPLLYTYLVKTGVITLEKLIELIALNPRKRFNIPLSDGDYTVFDLEEAYTVDPEEFLSKGRATPFEGWKVFGRCLKTVCGGKTVYLEQEVH